MLACSGRVSWLTTQVACSATALPRRAAAWYLCTVMSHLELKGLRVRGRIGCKDAERAHPQMLRVDVRLHFDMHDAIESDDVACSIDYKGVASCIRELVGAREWRLLETCAHDIGHSVRALSPRITRVETTLFKDVIADAESVSATVICAR